MKNGTRRCSVLGSEIESGVNQLIYMFYDNASLSGLQERVVQCYALATRMSFNPASGCAN